MGRARAKIPNGFTAVFGNRRGVFSGKKFDPRQFVNARPQIVSALSSCTPEETSRILSALDRACTRLEFGHDPCLDFNPILVRRRSSVEEMSHCYHVDVEELVETREGISFIGVMRLCGREEEEVLDIGDTNTGEYYEISTKSQKILALQIVHLLSTKWEWLQEIEVL